MRPGPVYEITCILCQEKGVETRYFGESARTSYDRGLEHLSALENLNPESPLVEHHLEDHQGAQPKFHMKHKSFHNKPLHRQCEEAHLIEMYKGTKITNRKGEWGQNLSPKLVIEGTENQDKKRKWSRNPQHEPEASEVSVHESTQGNPPQQLKATQPPTKKQRTRQESIANDPPNDKSKSSHLTVKQILARMREI